MNDKTPVSVLQRAKELVAVGWVGRQPKALDNEVCVQTAVNQALTAVNQALAPLANNAVEAANNAVEAANERRTTFLACQNALLTTMGHHHQDKKLYGAIPLHNDECLQSVGDALDWLDRAITHVKEVDA